MNTIRGSTKVNPVTPLEVGAVLRKEGEGKHEKVLDNTEQKACIDCYNSRHVTHDAMVSG